MEQKLTVTEIVNDKTMHNPEKIRLLYLQHDKSYEEIGNLLGLKVSTVRFNVSYGGYCKRKRGCGHRLYGDLRSTIKQMAKDDPDITAIDIAADVGCGIAIVNKYARELGITFKRRNRNSSRESSASERKALTAECREISKRLATEKDTPAEQPLHSTINSSMPIEQKLEENDRLEGATSISIVHNQQTDPSQEKVATEDVGILNASRVHSMGRSDKSGSDSDAERNPENFKKVSKSEPENSPSQSTDQKPKKRSRHTAVQRNTEEKPYEVLDWPLVIYNGEVYKVLSKKELRKILRETLTIKPKSNRRNTK